MRGPNVDGLYTKAALRAGQAARGGLADLRHASLYPIVFTSIT